MKGAPSELNMSNKRPLPSCISGVLSYIKFEMSE